ncbi:phosphate/phosphite/phosphonate ABC transporter substrate-binding protein [Chryseolinea sp. T2]|uniref:phosphate/phosphite/phosphonate ABC transporter substrate-binding protein n=1 Tax=Chryseolinea sp. T2 TaxID=3129255 RepID=UPI003078237A
MRFLFLLPFFLAVTNVLAQEVDFYLTPSISNQVLEKNGSYIKEFLGKETGVTINLIIPSSYDELVDGFGKPNPCFAIMSSLSYVHANKKHEAVVKLRTVRYGRSVYQGMIVVSANSNVKDIKDLNGKSIAFTDELSTSGYLYPKSMMQKAGVKAGNEVFARKHDEVIKLVYEGKADAGAAFYSPPSSKGEIHDARARVKAKYPDVEKKVIVLATTDPIPNDPIVFSKKFDPETARKLYTALVKLSTDAQGKQVLLELYGTEGFTKASDSDYNSLRSLLTSLK